MFGELKVIAYVVVMITCAFFTIPIALTTGINVAQKIGLGDCIAPQVQNTK